jgi:two-component system, OmpR family, heavy metal sensor histidine kinase CusS
VRSIRFRLTAWYAVILTAGFALFGGLIWLSLRHRLLDEIDQDLDGRASRFEKYFKAEAADRNELDEFCQALPPLSYVDVQGDKGYTYRFASASADLRMLHRRFVVNAESFDLAVGTSIAGVQHTLDLLRFLLLSLSPIVIVIACAGGAWLSGRALKPVTDITAAALNISIENLSDRLPVPATGDELADLTNVLNTMLARLESAVKTLSQFVADASHEFRTPLAVIRATAELALRRARAPEAYRDSLQDIAAEAERMTVLVEDLLILARSDAGVADMPLSPLDLSDILQEVIAEVSSLAQFRGIHINSVLRKVMITGNRPALRRLFLVLLDNALKFSPEGSEVNITLSDRFVEIKDFGNGISESDLPHIFKRFYQADRARSQGGYGLGLSLADSIVKAHGGSIQVSSTPGAGSSFRVILNGSPSRSGLGSGVSHIQGGAGGSACQSPSLHS